jgi:acetyl esterase
MGEESIKTKEKIEKIEKRKGFFSRIFFSAFSLLIIWIAYHIQMRDISVFEPMDLKSYLLAKTSFLLFPMKRFPKNETALLERSRSLYSTSLNFVTQKLLYKFPQLKSIRHVDRVIPAKYVSENGVLSNITLRIYNFAENGEQLKKVLVWYHGGGWVLGSMDGDHGTALRWAHYSDFVVVNVDYRLAPEHIFPAAIYDAYQAFEWVRDNIREFGGNPEQIFVAGESAGGNLATAVTSKYLDDLIRSKKDYGLSTLSSSQLVDVACVKGLVAVYPVLNATSFSDEAKQYAQSNGILTMYQMEWFRRLYQGGDYIDHNIRSNYLYSPFLTPDPILDIYPPSYFILAKYDMLSQESYELIDRLKAKHNRPVFSKIYETTVHGFFAVHDYGHEAIIAVSKWMKNI